jgi:predicted HicB family RNase H-like nuclease
MTNILRHKGYAGRVEFDAGLFFGRIAGIEDGIGFHADTVAGLVAAFEEAVDDYLGTCAKIGKAPESPIPAR